MKYLIFFIPLLKPLFLVLGMSNSWADTLALAVAMFLAAYYMGLYFRYKYLAEAFKSSLDKFVIFNIMEMMPNIIKTLEEKTKYEPDIESFCVRFKPENYSFIIGVTDTNSNTIDVNLLEIKRNESEANSIDGFTNKILEVWRTKHAKV